MMWSYLLNRAVEVQLLWGKLLIPATNFFIESSRVTLVDFKVIVLENLFFLALGLTSVSFSYLKAIQSSLFLLSRSTRAATLEMMSLDSLLLKFAPSPLSASLSLLLLLSLLWEGASDDSCELSSLSTTIGYASFISSSGPGSPKNPLVGMFPFTGCWFTWLRWASLTRGKI